MRISNYAKTSILIETITSHLKNEDPSVEKDNVKLFYCGRELKAEEDLWSYKINEENIIQIFIRKLFD